MPKASLPRYDRNYPTYPEGWFAVARSSEVKPGQVVPLHYFGRELVVFRGENGRAQVADAFCPHLGTHLGHRGKVRDNTIVCPFHGWRFDAEGQCVEIPYCGRIPRAARIETWPTAEVDGIVLAYHSATQSAPRYAPPELPEFRGSDWLSPHTVDFIHHGHPQDVLENSVDRGHMPYVHGLEFPTDMVVKEHGDRFNVEYTSRGRATFIGGLPGMRPIEPHTQVNIYGLGFATAEVHVGRILHYLVRLWVTPIGPDRVHARYTFSARYPGWSRLWGRFILAITAFQTARELRTTDIVLWDRKRFASPPVLCEADDLTARYRHWASRFYPPQPTLATRTAATRGTSSRPSHTAPTNA
jgi:phenylpropionate dioxygenase-like ring-hydroxylating dioxygenase large terminal subunit